MQYFEVVGLNVFSVFIVGFVCSANDLALLKARVKLLETRLNLQSSVRDEEYAEITERLDDIDKALNVTIEQVTSETTDMSSLDHHTVDLLKDDYAKIRQAFREDKTETERMRRDISKIETHLGSINEDVENYCTNTLNKTDKLFVSFEKSSVLEKQMLIRVERHLETVKSETGSIRRVIPNIEYNLISIYKDVENYCQGAVNNTEQLLTTFEASSESEKRILLDVKEQLETVTKRTEDNMKAEKQGRLTIQDMATKIQLNTEIIKKMSEQIENLETVVTNQFLRIERLLYDGFTCLYLKNVGNADSGVYNLRHRFVYCDQVTDGGGWTVFQRRINGEVDFNRNWNEYKNGFGDLSGEFWLGNDHLSLLTADGNHELRVEMEDFDGNRAYAKCSKFKIYPEEDKYKLEVSGYRGTAGDCLKYVNGMMFSTFDSDNDTWSGNCADKRHGAWWYKSCTYSNLNGQYFSEPGKRYITGIYWYHWKSKYYSLKSVEMKFR